MENSFDCLIIGAGYAGAVAARELAERGGRRVLVLERRDHIGGNAYDRLDEAGVLIHQYGPHIFHPNDEAVFRYLCRFTRWRDYQHRVIANIPDEKGGRMTYPVPFNLTSLELAYGPEKAARLEEADFAHVAAQYRGAGSVLHIAEPLDGDGARRLCDAIAKAAGGRCAVFAGQDGDYRYAVIESGGDLRQFIKDMNTALHGRGGGRDGFAQGSAACTAEEVRAFFQAR